MLLYGGEMIKCSFYKSEKNLHAHQLQFHHPSFFPVTVTPNVTHYSHILQVLLSLPIFTQMVFSG